jgi:GT2 family glycosyltransferase
MQMAFPRIAIILLNYRTAQLTLDCLASLEPEVSEHRETHVFVLDSASGDDSAVVMESEAASRQWKEWVSIVRLPQNGGFSAGNNAGIAAAQDRNQFDGFLLINSDTIVRRGALSVLSEVLQREPSVGLVGPRLEWPGGQLQVSCFRNISPASEFVAAAKTGPVSRLFPGREVAIPNPPTPHAVDSSKTVRPSSGHGEIEWISFACVLIRKEVFASIGGMDEGFFMYFEDVDYCRRARNAGWHIAYAPDARVVHLRGGRTPDDFEIEERKRRPAYYYQSRARYLAKYYGRTGPWRANVCWLLGRGVSLVREVLGNKSPHTARGEAADIWKGSLCGFAKDVPTRSQ